MVAIAVLVAVLGIGGLFAAYIMNIGGFRDFVDSYQKTPGSVFPPRVR